MTQPDDRDQTDESAEDADQQGPNPVPPIMEQFEDEDWPRPQDPNQRNHD